MEILLILAVSAAFTKGIFNHRENMAYARKGVESQRGKRGGGGPGFFDYARTLWSDLWDDAKKRHERERAKKRPDGGRRARDVAKDWGNWVRNPLGENNPDRPRPGDVEEDDPGVPDRQKPDPQVPVQRAPEPDTQVVEPHDPDARFCGDCGERLVKEPDGYYHKGRRSCPATGSADPLPGPATVPPPAGRSPADPPPPPSSSNGVSGSRPRRGPADPAPSSSSNGATASLDDRPTPQTCPDCGDILIDAGLGRYPHKKFGAYCPVTNNPYRPPGAAGGPPRRCAACNNELDERGLHLDYPACPADAGARPPHPAAPTPMTSGGDPSANTPVTPGGQVSDHDLGYDPRGPGAINDPRNGAFGMNPEDPTLTGNAHGPSTANGSKPGGTVVLEFNYDAIVQSHDDMLTVLNARLEQALAVKSHAEAAAAAADGMDNGRATLITTATSLVEAMQEAQFDASSVAGCTEAAEAFSASDAATVEEQCQEVVATAQRVIEETSSAVESVQASRDHIVATYGHLAEGVQGTGVRGDALMAS